MVHLSSQLDATFAALADATRRGVLEQLGRKDCSIGELADRFAMTVTGMKKHVTILEGIGLVATAKVGRVRTCTLGERSLSDAEAWLEQYRSMWSHRFAALDRLVEDMKQEGTGQ